MGFTTACFIRKNTPELRLSLHNLGYENSRNDTIGDCIATATITQHYNTIPQYCVDSDDLRITWKENRVDCGTNEELFLALAALRDDTDKNQWIIDEVNEFFDDDDAWMICNKNNMNDEVVYTHYRKATKEEIIEHFKR